MKLSAEKLKRLIRQSGMSHKQVATAVGIAPSDISRYMTGVNPRPDKLEKLAEVLRCKTVDLLQDASETIQLFGDVSSMVIIYTPCGVSRLVLDGKTVWQSQNPHVVSQNISMQAAVTLPQSLAGHISECLMEGLESSQKR